MEKPVMTTCDFQQMPDLEVPYEVRPQSLWSHIRSSAWRGNSFFRPNHNLRYAIDPTRMRKELGWRPPVTLKERLERTVQWYLDNEDWWQALQNRDGVGARLGVKA